MIIHGLKQLLFWFDMDFQPGSFLRHQFKLMNELDIIEYEQEKRVHAKHGFDNFMIEYSIIIEIILNQWYSINDKCIDMFSSRRHEKWLSDWWN